MAGRVVFLAGFFLIGITSGQTTQGPGCPVPCKPCKDITEEKYKGIWQLKAEVDSRCPQSCLYSQTESDGKEKEMCFCDPGYIEYKSSCNGTTTTPTTFGSTVPDWIAKKLIPLGFDNARGHYTLHDFDTEKMAKEGTYQNNCSETTPFRTINGTCNNLENHSWGAAMTEYRRLLPPAYFDNSFGTPRGGVDPSTLPSARDVSIRFHWQINRTNSKLSNLFYQFGQFVAHDSGLTPEVHLEALANSSLGLVGGLNNTACGEGKYKNNKKCFNINVEGDSFYKNWLPTYPDLGFARTLPKKANNDQHRQQVNAGSGFHDASIVYGHSFNLSQKIRTKNDGKLNTTKDGKLIPPSDPTTIPWPSVAAGDPRANMHPWILSLQTVFLREHNRLADAIRNCSTCSQTLTDEEIYQNSRRILIAEYQNIIYTEFLPLVIGAKAMVNPINDLTLKENSSYNKTLDPTIFNGFQTAAMRFGHSMVHDGTLAMQNLTSGGALPKGLEFRKAFFNQDHYYNFSKVNEKLTGNDEVLGGMTIQGCQHFDRHVSRDLTHYLYDFDGLKKYGDDLASRNIQRGRDHGLPPYMEYRRLFKLNTTEDSKDRSDDISASDWELLMDIYKGKPEDIDMWTGGLAEDLVEGATVGPLFQHIIEKQFHHSKFGDRFFFTHKGEAGSFTEAEQKMLMKRSMRDIVCQNSKIPKVRKHALEIRDDEELIPCNKQLNTIENVCDLIKCFQ